ncbi:hypothetical protein MMC14_004405 [Varicellaria rhodocarpa]|nr:hypothetical protein [Varicellaria rhodocarpa]
MKSLPSIKSTKAGEKDIGSITSRSQLNELSAENELPWGNHVSIYTTHRRSSGTEDDIQMDDLSIPPNAARVKNQVSWFDEADKKRQHSSQNAAELAA